ncbi:VOC family protein [Jiangella alba]|uniref:Glyoxalase-like domain-containing protein n=1 Tax=Jiangella alba TaxID=561176 RepID=A0A1H5PTE0_9ACTN|nr:VOC family protein [Jiangella alba]SEF17130.1 Glyoxalase-like domain-containing protein [Jiangella alba]
MRVVGGYAVVVTDRLRECRDFYAGRLGFAVVFEADWFVLLDAGGVAVAFMRPEHPSAPPSPGPHAGDGAFLTVQVADAAAEYETLRAGGARFALPLTDEPWGQRRFGLVDPAGQWVDVVEQTEPEPGWWDPYLA